MAYCQAQGTSPVTFVDANQSQQQLPLSEIYFTPGGVDASMAPLYSGNSTASPTNKAILDVLLSRLVSEGYLAPGTSSLSMTIAAVQAGALQYAISVSFANPTDTGAVDVTVSATQTVTGVTPGGLTAILGSTASASTSLAWVSGTENAKMPANVSQKAIGASLAVEAADNSETAFTLETTLPGSDAQLVEATLAQDVSGTTYTVTLSWTKTATAITMASLLSQNPFSYLVTVSGVSGPPPASGTVELTGGAAASGASPAVPASANLYA